MKGTPLSEEALNDILDSGDPDAIEAALAQMSETDEGFEFSEAEQAAAASQEGGSKEQPQPDVDAGDNHTQEQDDLRANAGGVKGEDSPYVEGKHGNSKIPYTVLENERKRAQDAEARARELEQQLQQRAEKETANERRLQVLTAQLEKNGLDPESLPEDFKLTDELKEQLVEDFGQAGKAMVALYAQMERLQQSAPSQAQPPAQESADATNPVMAAIERNEALNAWREGDTDRFNFAVGVDQQLRNDPKFANASLDERFAEVARRTMVAFGDPLPGARNAQQSADTGVGNPAPPASLSGMGIGATGPEKSLAERMVDMSEDEMLAQLETMPEAQREALLAQLGF